MLRAKTALQTLLVLYEIFATSKATEALDPPQPVLIEGFPPTEGQNLTTMVFKLELEPKQSQDADPEIEVDTIQRQRHGYGHNQNRVLPSKPHYHLPDSRFGPFFEEGSQVINATARVGSTITLDCRIGLLGDKTVTWTHQRNQSINLLTVGRSAYSKDERIHLAFRYPNNYRLQISYVTRRDDGMYECQVATHPPKIKRIFLKVTAPEVKIVDESGRTVHERYYRVGSSLLMTCLASSIGVSATTSSKDPVLSWKHGENVILKGISLNVSKVEDSAVSVLTLTPLEKSHSGNYTCAVGNLAFATVAVHVLNGELPAAVQTAGVRCRVSSSVILTIFCIYVHRR